MPLETVFIAEYFSTFFTGKGYITETMFLHIMSFKVIFSLRFEITLLTPMRKGTYISLVCVKFCLAMNFFDVPPQVRTEKCFITVMTLFLNNLFIFFTKDRVMVCD